MTLSLQLPDRQLFHRQKHLFLSSLGHSVLLQNIRDIRFSTIRRVFYRDNILLQHNFPAANRPNISLQNLLFVPYNHSRSRICFPIPCSFQDEILLQLSAIHLSYRNLFISLNPLSIVYNFSRFISSRPDTT